MRSSFLSLLIAFLAATTLTLPARAGIYGEITLSAAAEQSGAGHADFKASRLPVPAQTPLCHLRCRGFVANVPDAPPQQHAGTIAAVEIFAARTLPAATEAAINPTAISPPDSSPPRFTVLRL